MRTPNERGVVVLGMHRSGTSMVTGLLSRLGLFLPEVETLYAPTEFNPRGNQEVMELTAMNERLSEIDAANRGRDPLARVRTGPEALRRPTAIAVDRVLEDCDEPPDAA